MTDTNYLYEYFLANSQDDKEDTTKDSASDSGHDKDEQ